MASADSAVESVKIPRISGRILAANADSAVFGLMSSAKDAAGRLAKLRVRLANRARQNMDHLKAKMNKQ
jgi:hypothetical protein